MKPEAAAILWTALVLLWLRPGVLPGILVAIVCFEVFYLLSSLPITFLQPGLPFARHPFLSV